MKNKQDGKWIFTVFGKMDRIPKVNCLEFWTSEQTLKQY